MVSPPHTTKLGGETARLGAQFQEVARIGRLNVAALVFYAISLVLRWQRPPLDPPGWGWAMTLSTLALAILGLSGWLGGELVFKHRIGVVEDEVQGART